MVIVSLMTAGATLVRPLRAIFCLRVFVETAGQLTHKANWNN